MAVPFVNLTEDHAGIRKSLLQAFDESLNDSQFILGQKVETFERQFAEYCGVNYGIGVGSGTDALVIALMALDLPAGSEVIVPANTFFAGPEAILRANLIPRFIDADENTLLMNIDLIENLITPRTSAIMVVHLYGKMVPMDRVMDLAAKHQLKVIEDCAQAHGAMNEGHRAGSCGDIATFSFFPSKNLGALGDAGMIVTNNPALHHRARLLREHGSQKKYVHEIVGLNSRLDALQASLLSIKLKNLDRDNERRRLLARRYASRLCLLDLILPEGADQKSHSVHLYVIRTRNADRNELAEFLKGRGIATGLHYPVPCPFQPALSSFNYAPSDFPVAVSSSHKILSLPMYPSLTEAQVDEVCDAIELFFETQTLYRRSHVPGPSPDLIH